VGKKDGIFRSEWSDILHKQNTQMPAGEGGEGAQVSTLLGKGQVF
jgi:hypothetical protein